MSREYIANTLKRLREATGLKADEVGEMIGKSGKTVNAWENGRGQPDAEILIKLCNIYKVDNLLAEFDDEDILEKQNTFSDIEQKMIKKYRALDEHGKKIVDFVLNEEYDRSTEQESGEIIQTNCLVLTMYEDAVSAGTGEFLSDGRCVEVTVDETPLTERADFILRVSGDSMEPTYYDGDKVLVENAEELNVGEIGIFILNGQGYIKEYRPEGLLSHNKKYGIIKIGENDRCEVVGRVIGKI